LHHQLEVLHRSKPRRVRLAKADRYLWVLLSRFWEDGEPRSSSFNRCAAGSENFDHTFSGNSDHLPVALPGQKIVGGSASGEG
jgi:hypothetical protein